MVSPRRRALADRPRPARRQGTSKLGAVKLAAPSGTSSGATCSSQPADGQPQASAQPQQPAAPRGENTLQAQQRPSRPSSEKVQQMASALVADAGADAGFSDWGDSSFGFDSPAKRVSGRGAAGRSQPAKQQGPAEHGARPLSPNLLSHVQRGFRALIDGEAYVSERNHAASSRLQQHEQPDLTEASFLNKGLDAFNAVSRAAVGVATSLDSQIEQLMEQHGWADNRPGSSSSSKVAHRSPGSLLGNDGSAQDSLLQLPSFEGFDSGATLFGGAAAAVVGRDSSGTVGGQQDVGRSSRRSSADDTTAAKGKQVSPGVAEKMAALLPAFNHKDTVSEFLSEVQQVFSSSQLGLGSVLSLEPAAAKGMPRPQSGGACYEPLAPPEWGDDSEFYSSVFSGVSRDSSSHEEAAASLAAQIQRVQHYRTQQKAPEAISQPIGSPTANKENQGMTASVAQPGAVDWQDFLSGDSQVLHPAAGLQAASMASSGGPGSGSLSRQMSAQPQGCFSPPLPTTPPHNEANLRRAEAPRKQGECEKQLGVASSPAEAVQADMAEAAGAADGEPRAKAAEALTEPQLIEPTADGAYCGSPARPAAAHPARPPPSPGTDPLSEQVRAQLEALVAEKSALAQENARLLRENAGLQELLSYTMHQTGDGEAKIRPYKNRSGSTNDSDDDDRLSVWSTMEVDAMTLPSVENGSPGKKEKTSRRRLSMDSVEVSQNVAQLRMSTSDLDWAAAVPAADSIPAV